MLSTQHINILLPNLSKITSGDIRHCRRDGNARLSECDVCVPDFKLAKLQISRGKRVGSASVANNGKLPAAKAKAKKKTNDKENVT
jgi:hypothetical protein